MMTEYTGRLRFVDREIKSVDEEGDVQPVKTVRILQQYVLLPEDNEYFMRYEWVDVPLEVELEIDEDRSHWHPHHELIVAWARGTQLQTWHPKIGWVDCHIHHLIGGFPEERFRVKPDNNAEINLAIAKIEFPDAEINSYGNSVDVIFVRFSDGKYKCVDYCTDWSDIGPIIERENIFLAPIIDGWTASSIDNDTLVYSDTPTKAAALCYLMMKGVEI
jgi:hypothetical protein